MTTSQPPTTPTYDPDLVGAIARGWCHPKNAHKVMDSDLALAIAEEVGPLLEQAKAKAKANTPAVPDGWSVEPFWPKSRSLDMAPMFRVFRARPGTVDEWMRGPSGRALSFRSEAAAKAAILHRMHTDHAIAAPQPQPVAQPSERHRVFMDEWMERLICRGSTPPGFEQGAAVMVTAAQLAQLRAEVQAAKQGAHPKPANQQKE